MEMKDFKQFNQINRFEINLNNIKEVYTNSKHLLNENNFKEFFDCVDDVATYLKENHQQRILNYFKMKDLNYRWVLYTGQSFIDIIHQIDRNKKGEIETEYFSYNDLDFFIMDYKIRNYETDKLFETYSTDNYGDLTISSYGYEISDSEKIRFVENHHQRILNFVFYKDMYSQSEFAKMNLKKRLIYSALSTLNFFDINMVQQGILWNIETGEMIYLYTDSFYNFIKNRQMDFNRKRISVKTLQRYITKYNNLSGHVPIFNFEKERKKLIFDDIYLNNYYLTTHAQLFNILSKWFFDRVKEFGFDDEYLTTYEKLSFLSEVLNPYVIDNKFFRIHSNNNYILGAESFYYSNRIDGRFAFDLFENVIVEYAKKFKKVDFKMLKFEKILIPENDKLKEIMEFINMDEVNLLTTYNERVFIYKLHFINILSTLSLKKLKKFKEYCKKYKLNFIDIIQFIIIEPKILNKNLNVFKEMDEALGHSAYLFNIPFRFSLNPEKFLEMYLEVKSIILNLIDEFNKENPEINLTWEEFIGKSERYFLKLWAKIFDEESLEPVKEFFNYFAEEIKKEFLAETQSFHDFERIKVEENGFICEELICGNELKREGNFMKHCVGGYSKACADGESIIFRFYPANKKPFDKFKEHDFRYTMELSPKLYGEEILFDIIQIRGKMNKNTETEHRETINKLIDKVTQQLKQRKEFYAVKYMLNKNNFARGIFQVEPLQRPELAQPVNLP